MLVDSVMIDQQYATGFNRIRFNVRVIFLVIDLIPKMGAAENGYQW
jgi:hypothetical protein